MRRLTRQLELSQLLLQLPEVEVFSLFFLRRLMFEHHPAVDQVRGGQDVEERAPIRRQAQEARLGRLGAVGDGLADGLEALAQAL